MIRRTRPIWNKAPRRTSASASPRLALAKGPTRSSDKAKRDAAEAARIRVVHDQVWTRSKGRCECCGRTERESLEAGDRGRHEMHETYSRAMTRRMRPERRFDARWCVRACHRCHAALTSGGWRVWFASVRLGANGATHVGTTRPTTYCEARDVWQAPA